MNRKFTRRDELKLHRKSDNVRSIEIYISAATISGEALYDLKEMVAKDGVLSKYHIAVKPSPAVPNSMGDAGVVLYAASVAVTEVVVHHSLEFLGKTIGEALKKISVNIGRKHPDIKKLEVRGSVQSDVKVTSINVDEHEVRCFSEKPYAINPKKTFVLLIGCADYSEPTIHPIPQVSNNVKELKALFADPAYFGIPTGNIADFTNLTTAEIRTKILEKSRQAGVETFIFYYAGHGLCTGFDNYSLAGTDSALIDGALNLGIDKPFLVEAINRSRAKHNIILVDACFSGMLSQGKWSSSPASEAIRGGYILTSSHAKEQSFYESAQSLTCFTGAFVDTIRHNTSNQTAFITLGNLFRGISKALEAKRDQAPTYCNGLGIDHSNFIIAKNPAFSIKSAVKNISAKKGDLLLAMQECEQLLSQFPYSKELRALSDDLTETYSIRMIVSEGDNLFARQEFAKASERYAMALEQHEDMNVRERLQLCASSARGQRWKKVRNFFLVLVSIFIAVWVAKQHFWDKELSSPNESSVDAGKNESARGPTPPIKSADVAEGSP